MVGLPIGNSGGLNLFFYNRFHLFVGYFYAKGLWLSKNQVVGFTYRQTRGLNLFFDNRFHLYVGYFLRRAKWSILPIDTFGYIALKDDLYP